MESVIQLCESRNSNYPDHFELFLNNCLEKIPNFLANDYLFAAVYFIILECGFCPMNVNDEILQTFPDSFDLRKMRLIKFFDTENMKLVKNDAAEYWVYGIPLVLGDFRCKCELQGVPSAENNTYLIINFLSKQLRMVKSLCLNTKNYTENNSNSSKHLVKLKNLRELTFLLKDKVANAIKEAIMLTESQGCYPHLLRLPEEIQTKIIYYLTEDSVAVQYLASTCSYFYNIISNDYKLWEIICISEFDGRILNKALHDVLQEAGKDDENAFRKVFFKLKLKSKNSTKLFKRPLY